MMSLGHTNPDVVAARRAVGTATINTDKYLLANEILNNKTRLANENKLIMKSHSRTDRFYTTPNLVRPPGAEIGEGNLLATNLSTGFDSIDFMLDLQTAAREPVLTRRVGSNGNEIDPQTLSTRQDMYTGRFFTTPDLVQPQGAEIEEGSLLAADLSAGFDLIDFPLDPQTAAREPVLARRVGSNGNEIDPQTLSTTAGSANAAKAPLWTVLFTQNMLVLSGSGEVDTDKDLDLIAQVIPTHGTHYNYEEAELEEARRRWMPGGGEEEKELMINSMNVDPLPQTAARESVLVRHEDKNERNKIMKTIAYTGHFYTTHDLVRPPGAEVKEGVLN
jgi:hypothetical protein